MENKKRTKKTTQPLQLREYYDEELHIRLINLLHIQYLVMDDLARQGRNWTAIHYDADGFSTPKSDGCRDSELLRFSVTDGSGRTDHLSDMIQREDETNEQFITRFIQHFVLYINEPWNPVFRFHPKYAAKGQSNPHETPKTNPIQETESIQLPTPPIQKNIVEPAAIQLEIMDYFEKHNLGKSEAMKFFEYNKRKATEKYNWEKYWVERADNWIRRVTASRE